MDNQVEKSQSAYLLFYKKKKMEDADTCTQDTSETSTHESLPLDISDNNQHQDADNIREKHEGEGEAEMSNDTAEFCEKESRDMDSFESRGVEIISDAEDSGRKTGAELREVDSERTNLDENLEVQSNGRGGIDGVTQRIPCEVLVGDEQFEKGTKTSSNYLTKDDREYEGNNCQNICKDQEVEKKHYGKQEGEENMEVNLEGDEEGKTKDDELTSGSNKEVKGQDNERSDHDSQVIHDGQEQASVWPLYHKGLIGGVLQRWLSFWKVLQSPQRNAGALSE
ncbi:high mobility group nucleosome-binding domain-containing protein 5-like [Scomber scombrus]|uniref:high mobility group nucleosome-binding domain-containing protein 5-like n=1 Tax=Scomber scombrus TaxID=13677 RepID=UPI002DDBFF9E|nr:high mobility group nucleosome-binding domain-containing protein 5-like [Scomber scombrus]